MGGLGHYLHVVQDQVGRLGAVGGLVWVGCCGRALDVVLDHVGGGMDWHV